MAIRKSIRKQKINYRSNNKQTNIESIKTEQNNDKQYQLNDELSTENMSFDVEHKVVSGESLSSIAMKYGLTYQELAKYNNIEDPNYILEGQVIKIPIDTVKEENNESNGSNEHTVVSGETLSEIAQKYGVSVEDLVKANNILNPDIIDIGQKIKIPNQENNSNEEVDFKKLIADAIKYGTKDFDFKMEKMVRNVVDKLNNEVKNKSEQDEMKKFVADAIKSGAKNFNEAMEKIATKLASFNKSQNNMSNFAISSHDHIDNNEGERERRIAYLTDGYSIDNPPSESELYEKMTRVTIPIWNGKELTERSIVVNKKLVDPVVSIFKEIADKRYPIEFSQVLDGGNGNYEVEGYEYRTTGSGTRLSDHSFGGAIDINAVHNPQTGPRDALKDNDGSEYVVNEDIISIFAKHGFYWGGDWNSSCDPMHFSFTGY